MPDYVKVIIGFGLVFLLVGIFILLYVVNKKTKAPDDCPKVDLGGCSGCMLSCNKREEDFKLNTLVEGLISKDEKEKTDDTSSDDVKVEKEDKKEEK